VTCGNGRLDRDEVCDDGNSRSGDGCPADCKDPCGDGVLDPDEVCDDGNTMDDGGCAADCRSLEGGFTLTPTKVMFTASEGEAPPVGVTVSARLAYRGDTVVFGYPPGVPQPTWVSITQEADAEGMATFKLEPLDTLVAGERSTYVRFMARHQSSSSLDTFDLPVSYRVEPSDLTLQATATSMEFTAAGGSDLPAPRTVSLMFNGPDVAVIEAPPWITVTAPPTPVTSPASFSIAINATALPAGGMPLSGDVRFATTRGNVERTATVHVTYRLISSTAEVRFVAPYVGTAGRGGALHVRGVGFPASGTTTIAVGGTPLGQVHPDSNTQITVSYPPLSEGRYNVTLVPEGSALSRAELVIVAPLQLTYHAIDAPSRRERIVYDAERQTIYGVNQLDQQIEPFVYADGNWSTPPPWSVPLLRDIALTPDGRSLIAIDRDAINEIPLTSGVSPPIQRAHYPGDRSCGKEFSHSAATDSGTILVTSRLRDCTGYATAHLYDTLDHSLRAVAESYNGHLAGSADGSRIYLGGNGLSPAPSLVVFDSLSGTAFSSTYHVNINYMTVSGDASRMIEANSYVYDRSLTFLGKITFNGIALASRDSRRAFMYVLDNAGGAHLEIYDLTAPLDESGFYPRIRTMMLPDTANATGESIFAQLAMTTSLDDRVVFISGDRKLLVVPVD
jgi:cysteine-rich repeat protein